MNRTLQERIRDAKLILEQKAEEKLKNDDLNDDSNDGWPEPPNENKDYPEPVNSHKKNKNKGNQER